MGSDSRASWWPFPGARVPIVLGSAAAFLAVVLASASVTVLVVSAPPPQVVAAGQETFEALRLTDSDVAPLGLTASEGGRIPATLSSTVARMSTDWDAARGTPDSCMFAGTYRGISKVPVWGSENDSDAMWAQDAVSATQTLAYEGGLPSFITLSTRAFENERSAAAFMSEHDEMVAACSEFATTNLGRTNATTLSSLLVEADRVETAGWVASTDDWIAPGEPDGTASDMLCWIIDLHLSNVVQRITVVAPASSEGETARLIADLVDVVALNLVGAVAATG